MLSGRGLCDGLITRPEESYRLWCVVVCDLETTKILVNEEEAPTRGLACQERERDIHCILQNFGDEMLTRWHQGIK